MRYLLRTNTGYEHLAKEFEPVVLTHVERDGLKIAVCLRSFFCFFSIASFSERELPL